jgi:hypothetical protein
VPQTRAITGKAAVYAAQRRREGATVAAICRELGQRYSIEPCERTVRRLLASMGIAAVQRPRRAPDPLKPTLKAILAEASREPQDAPPIPDVQPTPPKPTGAAGSERGRLQSMIDVLTADMALGISPIDRAAIARTIAGLAQRVTAIDAAARADREMNRDASESAAWVIKKLKQSVEQNDRAREAALAQLPPEIAKAVRYVLAAEHTIRLQPWTTDEGDAAQEEPDAQAV